MNKSLQVLAEKYELVKEIGGFSTAEANKLVEVFYNALRDATYGEVPTVMKELVQNVSLRTTSSQQAEALYNYITSQIFRLAIINKEMEMLQRFRDVAKIMRSGLGTNAPGLN